MSLKVYKYFFLAFCLLLLESLCFAWPCPQHKHLQVTQVWLKLVQGLLNYGVEMDN